MTKDYSDNQLLKITVIQFKRDPDREKNFQNMLDEIKRVPETADVIVLPEAWLTTSIIDWDEYLSIMKTLLSAVSSPRCLLVSGAQYIRDCDHNAYSRGVFLRKDPTLETWYEKIFPSRAIGEREYIRPGSRMPVLEHRGVSMGAAVCVDLFYPELVRGLARIGARVIFNPANIPLERMDMWQALGLTRACENTVFTVMANNSGATYPDGREVAGRSFVAGPDGRSLLQAGREPGHYHFTLDLKLIDRVRQRWPYLSDVRERDMDLQTLFGCPDRGKSP